MSQRIIIVHEEIEMILERLDKIEASVRIKQKIPEQTFFDNQEFLQIMNISKRTAQTWRDSKLIAYSQVGSKIYYRMADILNMLNTHFKTNSDHEHNN